MARRVRSADMPDQEAAELRRLAASASGRDLMRLFRLMADAQEQLFRSPYPDLLLEMAVIRMATLAPVIDADDLMRAIGSSGPTGTSAPGATTPQAAPAGNAPSAAPAQTGARRIPISGEVKADAPRRVTAVAQPTPASVTPPTTAIPAARPTPTVEVMQPSGNLAELREFIRARRAALAGFMEQGAALQLNGDVLTVTPLNDIYIRYLNDNRNVIAELASELYGRKIRAELAPLDKTAADRTDGAPAATAPVAVATSSSPTSVGPAPASPPASNPISNSPASNPGANEAIPESRPATPADAAASGSAPKTQGEARQALYADPVARRIFAEFEARLVEVRVPPAPSPAPLDEPEAED